MGKDIMFRSFLAIFSALLLIGGVATGFFLKTAPSYQVIAPTGAVYRSVMYADLGNRTVVLPGLHSEVTVVYDRWWVPHIYASNLEDLFIAYGYVQAENRLFQMDLMRRIAEGRLSELVGEIGYETDVFFRTIDLRGAAERSLEALPENIRRFLEAYSMGVNHYIETGETPLEYRILGAEPEPWRPLDTVAIAKLMAWGLSGSFGDLFVYEAVRRHGPQIVAEIGLLDRPHTVRILGFKDVGDLSPIATLLWRNSMRPVGSNNWVVSPRLTAYGKPILANDPHLRHSAPPIWFEAFLSAPGYVVRGYSFPGTPFIVIGVTPHHAWGFTNVGADVIDFYYYVWKDGKYWYRDGWREPRVRVEVIKIRTGKGFEERRVEVLETVHGPVIERQGKKLAVKWVGSMATMEPYAIFLMGSARSFEEFERAVSLFHNPAQNIVYADVEGNIAYWAAGKYPIRGAAETPLPPGMLPLNGSRGEGEWVGWIPFSEIPHVRNPGKGFVVTANNDPTPPGYRYYLGYGWADRFRAERITELLTELSADGLTLEECMRIQGDVYVKQRDVLLPFLRGVADRLSERAREAYRILAEWDGNAMPGEKGPTVLYYWIRELKSEFRKNLYGRDEGPFLMEALETALRKNLATVLNGSRDEFVARTFEKAVEKLFSSLGGPENWEWGRIHVYAIEHPLGTVLTWLNYPVIPARGFEQTVNPASGLRVGSGASMRMVVVPGWKAYNIIPGGNRGHPFSRHYHDQLIMWAEVRYKEMDMSPIGEARGTVLRLLPG